MIPIRLFCAVAAGLLLWGSAAQAQVRSSEVERPGKVKLTVIEAGDPDKPGILFLHGFGQSALSFRRQFNSDLAKSFHLVAFDARGQGGSDKPSDPADYMDSKVWADDVAAVMAATHLKKPVIVGWSFGGYVALDYVRHYGVGSISGIDVVASTGGMIPPQPATKSDGRTDAFALSIGHDLAGNIAAGKETAAHLTTANMTPEERDAQFATEMMMPGYVRRIMAVRDYNHADMVAAVKVPVLVSYGSLDVIGSKEVLAAMTRALPDGRVSIYEGGGHLPFVEFTDRFNRELADFARAVGAR